MDQTIKRLLRSLPHQWGKAKPKTTWTMELVIYWHAISESVSLPNESGTIGNKLEITLWQLSCI